MQFGLYRLATGLVWRVVVEGVRDVHGEGGGGGKARGKWLAASPFCISSLPTSESRKNISRSMIRLARYSAENLI